jgi:hypothetical protein
MRVEEMLENFHVIELAPGCYFCGSETRRRRTDGKVHFSSVGTPLLAKRADPVRGDLTEIKKVFPQARFVYVRTTWNIS